MLANRPLFSKSCKDDTYGRKKQGESTTDIEYSFILFMAVFGKTYLLIKPIRYKIAFLFV